ncbi:adenosine-specific kinase [Picrophilus oshimae]|uniref:Adenosine monophosphate-protein transferase n=1 Tax=Picrophilus torridus (strain ATCC 700027 / DSM 9790 / JCM 10055 / NBRC 100828 / KAW 2/3) TaxID=1122961 RepID=Q6L0A6_PICTO|nr:adenosine-specific kinase [Picrophilus oshimae]AAT43596.1 hypothetical protein PTO1011 [Picrophilus oshimae DSM 9789]SMD31220.1 hypothetical protein SAMN02745355_1143 [Picrophilus oshimae DSM 9789]
MIREIVIERPDDSNVILGYSHFIKTIEDLKEIVVTSVPKCRFGIAFSEASGERLIRFDGNDRELTDIAVKNLLNVKSGHTFIIIIRDAYPINMLNAIKMCQEVGTIFAATANPLSVIVYEGSNGNGILGVIDGYSPLGIEDEAAKEKRKKLLRDIGYKS